MPVFSVKYWFTCSHCMKHTEAIVSIAAPDVVAAREFAVKSAGCEFCHQPPSEGTFVSTEAIVTS